MRFVDFAVTDEDPVSCDLCPEVAIWEDVDDHAVLCSRHKGEMEDALEECDPDPQDTAGDLYYHELAEEGRLSELDQPW